MAFYDYTLGNFLTWLEGQGITSPSEVQARQVRAFLASIEGKSDSTINAHARAIKTLLRFWNAEKYMPESVKFAMPRIAQKRLPTLTANEVSQVLAICNTRDKAIVLLMVDSGLRRAEVCALNWSDVDPQSGLVKVKRGKGGKARSAVIGATTRRALLSYRRTLQSIEDDTPLFLSRHRTRLSGTGLLLMFRRLSKKTEIHVTPHALRRTFVILSLRDGMDVLHLQALLGHSSLEMVQRYAQMIDEDLLQAHRMHSPIDNLARLK